MLLKKKEKKKSADQRKLDKKHDKPCEFVVPQIVKITLNKIIINCINTTINKNGEDITVSSLIAQINALISCMARLKSSLTADTSAVYTVAHRVRNTFRCLKMCKLDMCVLDSKEEKKKKTQIQAALDQALKKMF